MPKIIIPFSLRKHASDQSELMVVGDSLKDTMERLSEEHPGLKDVVHDSGLLSVFVNSKLIKIGVDNWDKVSLNREDEISLIIPIAGG